MKNKEYLTQLIKSTHKEHEVVWVEPEEVENHFRCALKIKTNNFVVDHSLAPYTIDFEKRVIYFYVDIEKLEQLKERQQFK